jgi:hypothetical protein
MGEVVDTAGLEGCKDGGLPVAMVEIRTAWDVSAEGGGGREAWCEVRQRKHSPVPKYPLPGCGGSLRYAPKTYDTHISQYRVRFTFPRRKHDIPLLLDPERPRQSRLFGHCRHHTSGTASPD